MLVEIRIYRRHDADLIMLKSYGISIPKMMRLALENYVEGERIKFPLPDAHPCDISKCSMLRYRLNVTNPKIIKLLKSVKKGYRNQFCKTLLRDMMDTLALGVFLESDEDIAFEEKRLKSEPLLANTDLGLIAYREDGFFKEEKKISKDKEEAIREENDKVFEKEQEGLFVDINEDESRNNEMLFSMFEDMVKGGNN